MMKELTATGFVVTSNSVVISFKTWAEKRAQRIERASVDDGDADVLAAKRPRLDTGDGHLGYVTRLRPARTHGGGDGGGALIQQLGHLFFLNLPSSLA